MKTNKCKIIVENAPDKASRLKTAAVKMGKMGTGQSVGRVITFRPNDFLSIEATNRELKGIMASRGIEPVVPFHANKIGGVEYRLNANGTGEARLFGADGAQEGYTVIFDLYSPTTIKSAIRSLKGQGVARELLIPSIIEFEVTVSIEASNDLVTASFPMSYTKSNIREAIDKACEELGIIPERTEILAIASM